MISYYLVQVIILFIYIYYILYLYIIYIIFILYIITCITNTREKKELEADFFNRKPTLFIKHILKHIPNCLLLPTNRLFQPLIEVLSIIYHLQPLRL